MTRVSHDIHKVVAQVCACLGIPDSQLPSLRIVPETQGRFLPSSFKVDYLAQGTIACFNLVVARYHGLRTGSQPPAVSVSPLATALEFMSERIYTIDGIAQPAPKSIGGLYKTKDGAVRVHDGFEVHRLATKAILGLDQGAGFKDVAKACFIRSAYELEQAAFADRAIMYAMRSLAEWDATPQGKHIPSTPIQIRELSGIASNQNASTVQPHVNAESVSDGCLKGLRVIELSRVIAAPVAGRALAAHGADVIWVTCPSLEDQPYLDRDFSRGKRSISLDLNKSDDLERLKSLVRDADVFIQSYRPDSLAKRGLGPEDLQRINPGIIYASMSAHPQVEGNPWRYHRGFDSMVQTCSGINVADAEAINFGLPPDQQLLAKVLPCQALDHASGFLLATGIVAALSKPLDGIGAYLVEVSLAGIGKFLRSLGQFPGKEGFEGVDNNVKCYEDVARIFGDESQAFFAEADSEFGRMKFLKHAGGIEGAKIGWDLMPRRLGSDSAEWT